MNSLIIDNSVVVKWYYEEEDSEKALLLLNLITTNKIKLKLPSLAIIELINSLKFGKKAALSDFTEVINNFFELEPDIVEVDRTIAIRLSEMIQSQNLTANDAIYIIIADQEEIPLITADYKHHQKSISKNIIWLKDWNVEV